MKDNTRTLTDQEKRKEDAKLAKERSDELDKKHFSTPLPLSREVATPESYPFSALGEVLGNAAKRIHEVVKSPDSICGNSILAAASLITQAYGDICIDGRTYPLSLFAITGAESGARKSAVDKIILKPVRDYEKMLVNTYKEEKRTYKIKMDVWEKNRAAILKSGEAAELEVQLDGMAPEPTRPLEPHVILEEPSYEGLVKLLAIGQPSLGLFSDEGAFMLGGYSMGKERQQATSSGLSLLWDGKPISRIRGADGNHLFYGKRLSLHLMLQENILASFLKNDLFLGQGLIARCLMVAPLPYGDRSYNETDIFKETAVQRYYTQASFILDQPFSLSNSDIPNELSPKVLELSSEAKREWILFHNEMDAAQRKGGVYAPIHRTVNKAAEQALRIAGVLTLFENIHANEVPFEVMERAIALVRYYLNELLRITDMESSNPLMELAQATLDWMKSKVVDGSFKAFTLQNIYQKAGPRGVRSKESALNVMKILEGHEQIKRLEGSKLVWELIGC